MSNVFEVLSQSSKIKDRLKLNTIDVVYMLIKHFTPRLGNQVGKQGEHYFLGISQNKSLSYCQHVAGNCRILHAFKSSLASCTSEIQLPVT